MSIINTSHRFIFVHVPKTAGTSVTGVLGALTRYCDQEIGGSVFGEAIQTAYRQRFGLAKHSTAAEIRKIVGPDVWSGYYTFSFVRNPFTRCLSTYNFLRGWKGGSKEFHDRINSFESFEEFVLSGMWDEVEGPDHIFRPQVHWLCEPAEKAPLTSFIGRVETLGQDLELILQTIAPSEHLLSDAPVPHLNSSHSPRQKESPFENPLVVERICARYAVDFDTFGYSRDTDSISADTPPT